MNKYELLAILHPEFGASEVISRVEKLVEKLKGKKIVKEEWNRRVLSYPIKKQKEGFYVFFEIELANDKVQDLDGSLKTDEGIIRHLIVKKAQRVAVSKPRPAAAG